MKFYTEETPFIISQEKLSETEEAGAYVLGNASADQLFKQYLTKVAGGVFGEPAFLFYVTDYPKVVAELKSKFKLVEAAGGIVEKEGKILFIKRLGKWDLPKGKVEKGEQLDQAAVREVVEECQVEVELKEPIGETWHTYVHKGRHVLKCTHWFSMTCVNDHEMKPQTEEEIEEVRWLTLSEVEEIVYPNTYQTIKDIYGQYLMLGKK